MRLISEVTGDVESTTGKALRDRKVQIRCAEELYGV